MFKPGLKIGQIIKNSDIVGIFKCGNMGGMPDLICGKTAVGGKGGDRYPEIT